MTTLNSRASKVSASEFFTPSVIAIVWQQPSLGAAARQRGKDPYHL
jgi:hypothetical protein